VTFELLGDVGGRLGATSGACAPFLPVGQVSVVSQYIMLLRSSLAISCKDITTSRRCWPS